MTGLPPVPAHRATPHAQVAAPALLLARRMALSRS